jgi:hypothetical protein
MARTLSSTSDHLDNASPGLTGYPATIACWLKNKALTTDQCLVTLGTSASDQNRFSIHATTTGGCQSEAVDGSAASQATASSTIADANWHLYTGVFTNATSYAAFLDGANKGTQSTSRAVSAFNVTKISAKPGANGSPITSAGVLAHVAVWNVALSDAEVLSLLTTRPSAVQPTHLVGYWTLTDNASPEPDLGTGNHSLTVTGTSYVADDPYPAIALFRKSFSSIGGKIGQRQLQA